MMREHFIRSDSLNFIENDLDEMENKTGQQYASLLSAVSLENAAGRLGGVVGRFNPFYKVLTWVQTVLLNTLSVGAVPEHVSFIMDGNRRYAKRMDKPVKDGHNAGGVTLIDMLHHCKKLGVKSVSAYAFSIENFNRSPKEVATLMELLGYYIDKFTQKAVDHKDDLYGIKLKVVGELSLLNDALRDKISVAEEMTKDGKEFVLYLALPYTSRNDIVNSMKLNIRGDRGHITEKSLTEQMYFDEFSGRCDLLIRTSGQTRLSDYMLWQVHDGGVVEFTNCLWPDFGFWRFYFLLLKWSFFKTWQQASMLSEPHIRPLLIPKIKEVIPFDLMKRTRQVALDSLPAPPMAVSVDHK